MSGDEQSVVVPADGEPDRLDRWLPNLLGISRGAARRLIDAGGVYVDGARCRVQSRTVGPGARLRAVDGADRAAKQARGKALREPPAVVFRDRSLLVVDKPAGMPSQASRSTVHGTVERWARDLDGVGYVALHHRLDTHARGLLALAIHRDANKGLAAAFRERTASRRYRAWVRGVVDGDEGNWHHGYHQEGRTRSAVPPREGLPDMRSSWRVAERGDDRTLLEVKLETGRTHQIRLQTAAAGHPILGDRWYGAGEPGGLRLQAFALELPHPVTGQPLSWELPPPADW